MCLFSLYSMCDCHSTRGRNCWCSYSPRNGIWNCQNFWSPCREARPTLICRQSWKRWVKVESSEKVLRVLFHTLIEWLWLRIWKWFLCSQEIRKGLLKAAKTTGAWIFTGGTNTGEFHSTFTTDTTIFMAELNDECNK